MNPITAIKNWCQRRSLQREVDDRVAKLTAELEALQAEITAAGQVERVRYFVSYTLLRTPHHNSGPNAPRIPVGCCMGQVDVNGPIDCWENVLAVQASLTLAAIKEGVPNPVVCILNFQEMAVVGPSVPAEDV